MLSPDFMMKPVVPPLDFRDELYLTGITDHSDARTETGKNEITLALFNVER